MYEIISDRFRVKTLERLQKVAYELCRSLNTNTVPNKRRKYDVTDVYNQRTWKNVV